MPSYSGAWNLVSQLQGKAQGNWPLPPFGYLLTFTNTGATNNIQSEVSVIDTATGTSYLIFNSVQGVTYSIRVAAISSSGAILWAKTLATNNSTNIYATGASQNSTHLFIAALGSGQAVIIKLAKSNGATTAARTMGTPSTNVGVTADSLNNRFYIQYAQSGSHRVGCFDADTFAAVWGPSAITYGGTYTAPVNIYGMAFNPNNSTAYGMWTRYNDAGTVAEPHIIRMTSAGISSVRNVSVGINRAWAGASFDNTGNIITSGDGYIASYTADLTTVNWGRALPHQRGVSENSFSSGNIYPWGTSGRFKQFATTSQTVPWSAILETGPGAAYQAMYVNGAAVYGTDTFICGFEDSFATGKNAYVLRYPVAGGFTGQINSTAEIIADSTTVTTSTPTTAAVSTSTTAAGTSFTDYSQLTNTAWSYTASLTTFIA